MSRDFSDPIILFCIISVVGVLTAMYWTRER
jgi:hypothetical protein